MRNIKIIVEYDGTNYSGWQIQKNALSIQQVIEYSVERVTGVKTEVIGASRTDAGVHAKGYVANFKTESNIPADRFKDALNTKLPQDIVILKSEETYFDFHSRYHSKGKTYCYTILNRENAPAIGRNFLYHVKSPLNIENMKRACKYFLGTHDFSAFRNIGSSVKTSTRTITDMRIEKHGEIIEIYGTADGFLYNMMRIIVGVLIQVGNGKLKPKDVEDIILSKDRKKAGKAAPASGLCLIEVFY